MTVPFHNIRACIFDALCEHPHGLTVHELIEVIYSDPDQEPDNAVANIRVRIHQMNKSFQKKNELFRIGPAGLKRYALFIRRMRK